MSTAHDKYAVSREFLKKINLAWPVQKYHEHVGRHPLVEIPLLAGLGALGGSMAAKRFDWRPGVGAGLAGLLAALYGVGKHVDTSSPLAALKSLTESDYYRKRPELLQQKGLQRVQRAVPVAGSGFAGTRGMAEKLLLQQAEQQAGQMQKNNSEKRAFFMGAADEMDQKTIPVNYSTLLVAKDPFLSPEAKSLTVELLQDSRGGPVGLTSGRDLYTSAVRAGAGFAAAYLFGSGLASTLGVEPEKAKKLSQLGGVAAAVINSGILKK
jgi:hypothetical protein